MNYEISKRYSLAEIGLLGFFVLGLIVAQMVVRVRQQVILSEPITLAGSGLSICKPISSGWESTANWQYESDNSLTLVAQQFQGTSREVEIRWRYQLCSPADSAKDILQHRAEQAGAIFGAIQTLDQPVPMDYVAIHSADGSGRTFYVGIAHLDFGRSIELQVLPRRVDLFYAENLFHTLAGSIQYQPSPQLQSGKDLVNALWETIQTGAAAMSAKEDAAFVIKNTQKQAVGYFHNQYSRPGANSPGQLHISNRQYELNQSLIESSLWVDGSEKTFVWKSSIQRIGMGRPRTYTIRKEPDDVLTVELDFDKDRQFPSNCLLLPELLLTEAAKLFLDRPEEKLVIDTLAVAGFVVPTVFEKVDPANALARSESIARVVKVDFLNHPQSFEELYFNSDGQLIGRLEQQSLKRIRLWELTTLTELQRIFHETFKSTSETVALVDVSQYQNK